MTPAGVHQRGTAMCQGDIHRHALCTSVRRRLKFNGLPAGSWPLPGNGVRKTGGAVVAPPAIAESAKPQGAEAPRACGLLVQVTSCLKDAVSLTRLAAAQARGGIAPSSYSLHYAGSAAGSVASAFGASAAGSTAAGTFTISAALSAGNIGKPAHTSMTRSTVGPIAT